MMKISELMGDIPPIRFAPQKRMGAFLLPFFLAVVCLGQSISPAIIDTEPAIDLSAGWVFMPGDSLSWLSPQYDDQNWPSVATGKYLSQQGYPDFNGRGCYRLSFWVPAAFFEDDYLEAYDSVRVHLGRIGDADETYLNGSLIGQTGSLEPLVPKRGKPRIYTIHKNALRSGAYNQLVVRMRAASDRPGLYRGRLRLEPFRLADFAAINLNPRDEDGLFESGAPLSVDLEVRLLETHFSGLRAQALVAFFEDEWKAPDTLHTTQRPIVLNPGESYRDEVAWTPPQAGFYQAAVAIVSPSGDTLHRASIRLGSAPEKLGLSHQPPPDLDEFWQQTRAQLAAVPPKFRMIRQEPLSNDSLEVFLVEMQSLDEVTIRAWYVRPTRADGPVPAMLELPWYTGGLPPKRSYTDMAVLTLHIRGHGRSTDEVNPGFPGYLVHGIEAKESYIYRGAYADCLRAVDFLCSRPEIDTSRIAAYGVSQGGGLTFAVTALDKRIAVAAARVPFLAHFPQYFQTVPWPQNEFEDYIGADPKRNWEDLMGVLAYFDVAHLAPRIQVPFFMMAGLQDPTCPPVINFAAYNQIAHPHKRFEVAALGRHGAGSERAAVAWFWEVWNKK
jgi:cephalosporin-C deacetylase